MQVSHVGFVASWRGFGCLGLVKEVIYTFCAHDCWTARVVKSEPVV